jgi:hypothetical protein
MARLAINAGKGGRTKVPTPGAAASFVPGSRPTTLRAAPVPRIKPMLSERNYGKPQDNGASYGFGDTGETSRS